MSRVIVFCGPSLPPSVVTRLLPEAALLAPAACGDVYRACRGSPAAIALIDGYFDHRRAVWHKELLWAVHAGVRVYAGGSMGALRGAELARYGVIGSGWIFEQFLHGRLEDDDEVAVVHASEEQGYTPLSMPMVNLRRTLEAAVAAGALSDQSERTLITELKALFYPHRSEAALRQAAARSLPAAEGSRFLEWLAANGIIDQKHIDASAVLCRVRDDLEAGHGAPAQAALPEFPQTNAWRTLVERLSLDTARSEPLVSSDGEDAFVDAVRRQWPGAFPALLREALERVCALAFARERGLEPSAHELQAASEQLRRERNLLTPESTAAWLSFVGLDVEGFSLLVRDTVLSERLAPEVRRRVALELRQVVRLRQGP